MDSEKGTTPPTPAKKIKRNLTTLNNNEFEDMPDHLFETAEADLNLMDHNYIDNPIITFNSEGFDTTGHNEAITSTQKIETFELNTPVINLPP